MGFRGLFVSFFFLMQNAKDLILHLSDFWKVHRGSREMLGMRSRELIRIAIKSMSNVLL